MITVGPRAPMPVSGDAAEPGVRRILPVPPAGDADRRIGQSIVQPDPGTAARSDTAAQASRSRPESDAASTSGAPRRPATGDGEDALIRRPQISLPERTLPEVPQPEPAGPLRTFAQVPTELMQELTRLRSAEAQWNAAGVPGRRDPTPVPAPADAIAPSREADAPSGAIADEAESGRNPYDR